MNRDEIIDMARQAGFFINDELTVTSPFIEDICISPMLKKFSKLVAAKEREACAMLCDEMSNTQANMNVAWRNGCRDAATEIRARGEA